MNIVTILGARPQFIKAAPVSHVFQVAGVAESIIHTGQHYDDAMSRVFFEELSIPAPHINLGVGSGTHARQTAEMMIGIETVLLEKRPDCVLVYGDTNSTIAGALSACKLGIPVAHVEAGLRSYNRSMPEEHNRVLTDHCANVLFCPTITAVENLKREGINKGVHRTGDTMYDAVIQYGRMAAERSRILDHLRIKRGAYVLMTLHRPYNTDEPDVLRNLIGALSTVAEPVVFPLHPRTKRCIEALDLKGAALGNVLLIDPVGYFDMLQLEQNARTIVTDSGGVQKEAYFFAVPCITTRPETEWVETLEEGWNLLVGPRPEEIARLIRDSKRPPTPPAPVFGDGKAAETIVELLTNV